jgi:hypothetical protein
MRRKKIWRTREEGGRGERLKEGGKEVKMKKEIENQKISIRCENIGITM